MPTHLAWPEIALRLGLTVLAGLVIGVNREEHGQPAGLRTILLVCLAASVAMIQVNLLLALDGRKSDSFVMLDLMRLPLGILSGIGFIGAGAILRRGRMVMGVTTAATLWFCTVIGLCFGGGQIGLGLASTALAVLVLWGLKGFERFVPLQKRATLTLTTGPAGPSEEELRSRLGAAGFGILSVSVSQVNHGDRRELSCYLQWRGAAKDTASPSIVAELARHPGVEKLEWMPSLGGS